MIENTFGYRKVLIKSLVGSHNRNLATPESDKDWRIFVMPNFKDLYYLRRFDEGGHVDDGNFSYVARDIRLLADSLWGGHILFIESLFSKDITYDPRLEWMINNRDKLSMMAVSTLLSSTLAWHSRDMKELENGPEFGYNTKRAYYGLVHLLFANRLGDTGDFGQALWFDDDDPQRQICIDVKNGLYTLDQFRKLVKGIRLSPGIDTLMEQPRDTDMRNHLHSYMQNMIFEYMKEEIITP